MAAQLLRAPVQGHARIAMRAGRDPAAGVAEQAGRITAPVQIHDDLPVRAQMLLHGLYGGGRQSLLGGVLAQIYQPDVRRPRRPRALRQYMLCVARRCGVFQGFERGCRGAKNDGYARAASSEYGEIARRIAKPFLLLVGAVMFFIDHDEGEIRHGGEHGGAGADDDPRLTGVRCAPGVAPLHSREARMHGHHARTEAAAEAIDQLRRQGDFRYQHQSLAAPRNGRRDDAQVHLSLAAAGHPVHEMRGESVRRPLSCPRRRQDGGDALRLRFGERHVAGARLQGHRRLRRSVLQRNPAARPSRPAMRAGLKCSPTSSAVARPCTCKPAPAGLSVAGRAGRWREHSSSCPSSLTDHHSVVCSAGWPARRAGGQCRGEHFAQGVVVVLGRPKE